MSLTYEAKPAESQGAPICISQKGKCCLLLDYNSIKCPCQNLISFPKGYIKTNNAFPFGIKNGSTIQMWVTQIHFIGVLHTKYYWKWVEIGKKCGM